MNRIRKHRCWHREAQKMIYASSADIFKWLDEGQPIDIMDFTGLLDKNGKEIWEGDIVKGPYNDRPIPVEFITLSNCGFEPFSDSAENCGHCGGGISGNQCEIIGNIHENSELLSKN